MPNTSGSIIRSWGGLGDGTGSGDNCGIFAITADSNGSIYEYEFEKAIKVYDSHGVFRQLINSKEFTIRYSWTGTQGALPFLTVISVESQPGRKN